MRNMRNFLWLLKMNVIINNRSLGVSMRGSKSVPQPFGTQQPFLYDLEQRHDHHRRALVFWLGEWEVLMYRPCSDMHHLLVVNGMFHLQLWHPESKTSILTPTALTDGKFEVAPLFGSEFRTDSYEDLAPILEAARNLLIPHAARVSDVFFAMFSEFAWRIPDAAAPPTLRFENTFAAK